MVLQLPDFVISSSNNAETKLTHLKQLKPDITERTDVVSTGVSEENIHRGAKMRNITAVDVDTTITDFLTTEEDDIATNIEVGINISYKTETGTQHYETQTQDAQDEYTIGVQEFNNENHWK